MPEPRVSVVMGVFNGERFLAEAIQSILSQEGVDIEFIIVDDASTDSTPALLTEAAAADPRIAILRQHTNQGLTRSLIAGCAAARGEYIARIDADDVALPGRLKAQVETLDVRCEVTFVSCGTRFVTDEGDLLHERTQDPTTAHDRLIELDMNRIEGVSSHSSVMFRHSAYEAVGGYRAQFYFAQDLDLWIRLAERGRLLPIPKVHQLFRVHIDTLTSRWRELQVATTRLILESARLRRVGQSDADVLARAARLRPDPTNGDDRRALARAHYFLGACLLRNGNAKCRRHFRESVRADPLFFRGWFALLAARFR